MPTRRGDKWEGRLKVGGQVVRTKRFDLRRSAVAWEQRQRATFDEHGYDPSTGKGRRSEAMRLSHVAEG